MDYFPNYVAAISEGHTLPIESPRYRELTVDGPNLRIELLSALLRIADILDLSRRRANRAKELTLGLSVESQTHWWRHHYTEDIVIDQDRKLVSVWFDFPRLAQTNIVRLCHRFKCLGLRQNSNARVQYFIDMGSVGQLVR